MGRPCPITREQGDEMVRLYLAGESRNSLATKFGTSRPFVTDLMKARGVQTRTLREACAGVLRHDAFAAAEADQEAAYWTGFLMADGCVTKAKAVPRRGTVPQVIVQLQHGDAAQLVNFLKFVGSDLSPLSVKPGKRSGPGVRCTIYSERIAADLARYGVVPKKSKTARVALLERNRHFWRGVIDGDGSLGRRKPRKPTHFPSPLLQVVGSESLMGQFEAFARDVTGTDAKAHVSHGCWGFSLFSGAATAMISHLYTDCTVALARKWKLAHELLCEWELRPRLRTLATRRSPG